MRDDQQDTSAELFARAVELMPGGVNSPVRAFRGVGGSSPRFIREACGTTMIVYWEGACAVRGAHGGRGTEGRAYVELVGHDRSHEQPSLSTFIFGDALDRRWRSIFG